MLQLNAIGVSDMAEVLIGIDLGTTNAKTVVVDPEGNPIPDANVWPASSISSTCRNAGNGVWPRPNRWSNGPRCWPPRLAAKAHWAR